MYLMGFFYDFLQWDDASQLGKWLVLEMAPAQCVTTGWMNVLARCGSGVISLTTRKLRPAGNGLSLPAVLFAW